MSGAMDLVGAGTALTYSISCIMVFLFRLVGREPAGRAVGWVQILFVAPLVVLLVTAPRLQRTTLYYVQVGLLLFFIALETVVDMILRLNFRASRWVVPYVVIFFAATGGMLDVARLAGKAWLMACAAAFFAMAGLAFTQRRVTGL